MSRVISRIGKWLKAKGVSRGLVEKKWVFVHCPRKTIGSPPKEVVQLSNSPASWNRKHDESLR
jgi:hypothetical protein